MNDDQLREKTYIETEEPAEADVPLSGPLTGVNICVIGAGFVGTVTAAGFAKFGHHVICVEKDPERLDMLREGRVPFFEKDLEELIKSNIKGERLSFSSNLEQSLEGQKAIFVAVGTPSDEKGRADLRAIYEIMEKLGTSLSSGQIVVIRSTVPIGTAAELKRILAGDGSSNGRIEVISNPEFLREGTAVHDFFNPHRIVIGGNSRQAIDTIQHIYRMGAVRPAPTIITNNETAEMIKYASNAFLATKIGFINELAILCDEVGIDALEVARAMGMDSRIGTEFLNPGPGWGGSCLPKDLKEFTGLGISRGRPLQILEAVKMANVKQHNYVVTKIEAMIDHVSDRRIGILGLSFKAETSDLRDSPALAIARKLIDKGFAVRAFDPAAGTEAGRELPGLQVKDTAYEALDGVDCAVILTEWSEFQLLDWKKAAGIMRHRKIVDARNILTPEMLRRHGFEYQGLGQN